MIRLTMTAVALAATGAALAKLPPLDEAAKAKAAETAAKTAWQAKVDAYQLCKVQDRLAARYKAGHPAMKAVAATTAPANPAAKATSAPTPASVAAAAVPPPETPAKPSAPPAQPPTASASGKAPTPTAATASQGGSTPVATIAAPNAVTVPPCVDPGPFAYAPPEQKPLESSEAHSPAANATSPPSVRSESGTMTSGKTGGTPKK
jgi:hypothetical protein